MKCLEKKRMEKKKENIKIGKDKKRWIQRYRFIKIGNEKKER